MVAMEKQLIRKKKSNKISRTLQIIRLETYAALRLLSKGEDESVGISRELVKLIQIMRSKKTCFVNRKYFVDKQGRRLLTKHQNFSFLDFII